MAELEGGPEVALHLAIPSDNFLTTPLGISVKMLKEKYKTPTS